MSDRTDETWYGWQGLRLHIFKNISDSEYEVWWNKTEDFDGVLIGLGVTREVAMDDAFKTLSELNVALGEATSKSLEREPQ